MSRIFLPCFEPLWQAAGARSSSKVKRGKRTDGVSGEPSDRDPLRRFKVGPELIVINGVMGPISRVK